MTTLNQEMREIVFEGYAYLAVPSLKLVQKCVTACGYGVTEEGKETIEGGGGLSVTSRGEKKFTGKLKFRFPTPELLAFLAGGALSDFSADLPGKSWGEEKNLTITTNKITPAHIPLTGTLYVLGAGGTRFKEVAAAPAVGECAISIADIIFNGAETETIIADLVYTYELETGGQSLRIDRETYSQTVDITLMGNIKDIYSKVNKKMVAELFGVTFELGPKEIEVIQKKVNEEFEIPFTAEDENGYILHFVAPA